MTKGGDPMNGEEMRTAARRIVEDPRLTYHQRRHHLATLAENSLEYPGLGATAREALDKRVICDLYEGAAPYRPRYVLPDYVKAVAQGSEFLELEPPQDLEEALNFLLVLYGHVPSITGYPVYLGDLDKVLAPFVDGVSDATLERRLRLFWIALDRMFPDGFTHTDLGPDDTRLGRVILALERDLAQIVPNITLKVDPDLTPDDYLLDAVRTVCAVAKPHFVNHPLMVRDLGEQYAAVSCYNSLKIGGGAHTLTRLNLKEVALRHGGDADRFLDETLPGYVEANAELIEARIRHLVEDARFFEHDFLAQEGLIDIERFSAMYGVFGLAEAVNLLMDHEGRSGRYGHDEAADALGRRIVDRVASLVGEREMPYCAGYDGRCFLHSQSGIDTDVDVTAGTRIPIGDEPELFDHIRSVAPHHDHFAAGVSDVFEVDDSVAANPRSMVDVMRGAFASGMRDFTFNLAGSDFIRITGYLARRSDVERFESEGARHGSTTFAAGSVRNSGVTDRNVKRIVSHEISPRPHQ